MTEKTTAQWIEALRLDRIDRGWTNVATWNNDYQKLLGRLPQLEPLRESALMNLIQSTTPNSRQRSRVCMVVQALADFSGIQLNARRYRGRYSSMKPKPRKLPSDELIVQVFHQFKNPYWRWIYGLIATYGLRPHEALLVDFDALRKGDRIVTLRNGKTGPRDIWAFHPEWFDEFNLQRVLLPNVELDRSHILLGRAVSKHLRYVQKIPFQVYDLRHAWAVRTTLYGVDSALAAQQMGHSLRVHNAIYQKWIGRKTQQEAYERVLAKSDRPLPPKNIP
jgi:integrase